MNKPFCILMTAAAIVCTNVALQADPTGSTYNISLSATVQNIADTASDTEIYVKNGVAFDGAPELVPFDGTLNNLEPYLPTKPLWVDEQIIQINPTTERISFWLYGDDDGDATPPTLGNYGELFNNPFKFNTPVILQVSNLSWQPDPTIPVNVTNVTISLDIDGGDTIDNISTFGLQVTGAGSQASPLSLSAFINSLDFTRQEGTVTSIHLAFDVVKSVPEPASLLVVGGFALAVLRRRSKTAS